MKFILKIAVAIAAVAIGQVYNSTLLFAQVRKSNPDVPKPRFSMSCSTLPGISARVYSVDGRFSITRAAFEIDDTYSLNVHEIIIRDSVQYLKGTLYDGRAYAQYPYQNAKSLGPEFMIGNSEDWECTLYGGSQG